MKLKDINKKDFEDFCLKCDIDNFYQSKYYAEIKRKEGYHTYFVGLEQDGTIMGAALLLSKEVSLMKKRAFYAPRGFIIDYKNYDLVKVFSKELIEYVKTKNGAYIKINPTVILHGRDNQGNIVDGGINNTKLVETFKELGWQENDININFPLEDKILYELKLKNHNEDELLDSFSDKLKLEIKKNELIGITTKKLEKEEINKFIDIMEEGSYIVNHLGMNYANYKDIIDILDNHNMLDINVCELNIDKYYEFLNSNKEKYQSNEFEEQLNFVKQLQYQYGHSKLIGTTLGVSYHNKYYILVTAVMDKFKNYDPLTTLYWETIKNSKKAGNEDYIFYGIGNTLTNNNELNKLKDFNGKVIELIGEFDYILNERIYNKEMKKQEKKHK